MRANCGVAALLLVGALSTLSACATAQQFDASSSPPKRATAQSGAPKAAAAAGNDSARIRALAAKAAPNDPAEQERLLEEFMQWRKSQQKR